MCVCEVASGQIILRTTGETAFRLPQFQRHSSYAGMQEFLLECCALCPSLSPRPPQASCQVLVTAPHHSHMVPVLALVPAQLGAAVSPPRGRQEEDKTTQKHSNTPYTHYWVRMGQHTHANITGPPVLAPSLPLGQESHHSPPSHAWDGKLWGWETVRMGICNWDANSSLGWETIIQHRKPSAR